MLRNGERENELRGQPAELPGVSAEPGLEPAAQSRAPMRKRTETWAERTEHRRMNSEAKSFSGTRRRDESLNHQRNAWWDYVRRERTRRHSRFSAASPMMIFPPLLLVFSTESAVLRPCSCFPRPWPSLKPYFCMILWATVPLRGGKGRRELGIGIHCTLKSVLSTIQKKNL